MPQPPSPAAVAASTTHRMDWFGSGHALLEAKLEAIGKARHTVRLEIYIFTDSEIGQRFRTALVEAAQRGVKIWLLVDAVGGMGLSENYFHELTALPGAEMKWFNRPSLGTWAFRDHRKLLVIDSEVTFVGGCNIAEEYHGDGIEHGWRDGGLRITGPVALEMEAEFDQQFAHADEKQWKVLRNRRKKKNPASALDGIQPLFIRPGFGHNALRDAVRKDLEQARDIAITSAYFLPSLSLLRQFSRSVHRGARMRLLLGGKSDVRLMQLATQGLYSALLRRRIEVYEYQPQILHAKLLVIDDHVYVGSSNLDPRSMRINFEIMVRIYDPELAKRAREQFEEDITHSQRVTAKSRSSRSWWLRFRQRAARWILARLDPRLSEGLLRRMRQRRRIWR